MTRSSHDGAATSDMLRRAIQRLCRDLDIAELYVFGSRASEVAARVRGEGMAGAGGAGPASRSDIDVGVRPLGDVVVLPEANPFLALEAIRGELYGSLQSRW